MGTIFGARPLIEGQLVDVIQPDTGRAGGITQMRKIAAMAEAHGVMLAPHSGSLGPVAEFAALHVMATDPNALVLERIEFDWSGRYEVVQPILKSQDGELALPQSSGLGEFGAQRNRQVSLILQCCSAPFDDGQAYVKGTADEAMHVQTRALALQNAQMTKLDFDSGSYKVLAIEYNFITFGNAFAYWNNKLRKASNPILLRGRVSRVARCLLFNLV